MAQPHPFFLLLVILCLHQPSYAISGLNTSLTKAYSESLKLKLETSRSILQKELKKTEKNAVTHLISNYNDFLKICAEQNQSTIEKLVDAQEARLETLDDLKEESAWIDYTKAEVRAQLAMSELLFGNRVAAAWHFRKAYLQFQDNAKKYPDFIPNRKTLGVMQVLLGSVPDQYKWFLNIIGMGGNTAVGLKNLRIAAQEPNLFQNEAKLLYALLLQLLDEDNAKSTLKQSIALVKEQPDNLLFNFVATLLHKKAKMADAALQIYLQRPVGNYYTSFPYMHHLAADLYLFRGNYDASVRENLHFLKQHKGIHYLKAANYKLYLAYWLSNHKPQAKWHYQQIRQVGTAVTEEDNYAEKFVTRNEQPNRYLMLARLHSDGGYFEQAQKEVSKLDITEETPLPVRAEYYYRKARIYHGQQQLEQAKKFYNATISTCTEEPLYFSAHAALQSGYIYQQQKNYDLARSYYQQAIKYSNHAYKNSIQAKAKLALTTLP
ncbi:tetratricopeptide repeat protein [Pontibacter sp. KCTC 32443]|uniref:tetratricopeptide repeat protein n=1 Tax=Pontibacter TaxID=323449 RepID=UPI00164E4079|nr:MULTISPECIES: tetratricopeptide repeat protein [Pontibacter]MBC5773460.1 tetratricopeptide repeat protein [Pontibacter sp. KCTC 32443]